MLQAAVASDHILLAIIAVLLSLIGAYYYLRLVKLMYFDAPESHVPIYLQPDSGLLISINGLGVLLLGIMPGALMSICAMAVKQSLLIN